MPTGPQRDAVQAPCVEVAGRRLPGRQDGVAHAGLGRDAQRQQVDGRLRQPQAARSMTETQLGVTQAPADLRSTVASPCQGQDGVVERLRHDAMTGGLCGDRVMRLGALPTQPAGQRGAEIESDAREVAGRSVRPIAFGRDPIVPVAIGGRASLRRGQAAEGVLARRLVEVAMDGEPRQRHPATAASMAMSRASATAKR